MKYVTTIDEKEYLVEILDESRVQVGEKIYQVDFTEISEKRLYSLIIDGRSVEAYVYPVDDYWQVLQQGRFFPVIVRDELESRLHRASAGQQTGAGEFTLKAPMPGLVIAVQIEEGQQVAKGDVLIILESMKMQNELKSPRDGVVSRLRVEPGGRVEQHAALVTIA